MKLGGSRNSLLGICTCAVVLCLFLSTRHYAQFSMYLHQKKLVNTVVIHTDSHGEKQLEKQGSDGTNVIPAKIIHQSWKVSVLPPRFSRWSRSWISCFPNWKYKLWNDTENRDFIANHYPWFVKVYDKFPANINRADAVRYLYLFHYGGIYTDLDNECLQPFEHLLGNYSLVFGAMEGQFGSNIKEGYVQNSFMYSKPRHIFWLELLQEIIARADRRSPPESLAGPITLVEIINRYRKRFTKDIKIYPPYYFNPNSWLRKRNPGCKDYNQMSEEDEKLCKSNFKTSFVVQYHCQTWGRGKPSRK